MHNWHLTTYASLGGAQKQLRTIITLMTVLLFIVLAGTPVYADAITVNTTTVNIADDGRCSLAEAIIAANKDTASGNKAGECPAGHGADTIILPAGTYTLTSVLEALQDPMGLPFVLSDLTIEGNNAVIVRDPQAPEFGMVGVAFASGRLTMNNLTIRGGRTSGEAVAPGLAVFAGGTATLNHVTLIDNISDHAGSSWMNDGTVYVSESTLNLIDSSVQNNTGAHAFGILAYDSTLTLQNSVVSGHTEIGIYASGGTLDLMGTRVEDNGEQGLQVDNSVLTVSASTISGNRNGGMELDDSKMVMSDSSVHGNTTPRNYGNLASGLAIRSGSAVTMTRSSVIANDDPGDVPPCPCVFGQDGIRVLDSSLTVIDSLIADDRNPESMDDTLSFDGDRLRIVNSTITGAGASPLSIYKATQVEVEFSTIVSDFEYKLGPTALLNMNMPAGAFHIRNSIIEGCWQKAGSASGGYNVVPDTSCLFTSTGDQQNVDFDTLFGPLADNGGPTQSHALHAGVSAIDAIPNGVNGCQAGSSHDQRGAPRAGGTNGGGSGCDIGAFEANSSVPISHSSLYLPIVFRQMP